MSQQVPSVFTCNICIGRSTWDFLQDFYLRVEAAENHARTLEKYLYEAQTTLLQCQNSLVQCEASLLSSWELLNEERRNHQGCQEALMFESERQRETITLLERILKEAILSSEATEILGSRPTTVPKAAVYQMIPTLEASPTETTQIAKTLAESGTSISVERQSESAQQLLPSLAPNLHQLGEHESQTPAHICGTEVSNQRHQSGSRSGHSRSYATSKPTNVYGHAESAQVTESRRITPNKVRESPLRRTQFPK
ncbi:uncharacterized protein RAG0_12600 [Rhynchosporium agropyri]|uniref:Uncharacterized protein n=1 Tax=Rhynchosporium agropyri TaxID=914238 RepID=A0A1E1L9H1_9HELO|nr:uncharacterized protein RAG0_12600 [Rhynchosporium agropyri]